MLNDADLASLHARAEFKEFISQLKSQIESVASSMTSTPAEKPAVEQEMVTIKDNNNTNNNNQTESEIQLEATPSTEGDDDDYVVIKKIDEEKEEKKEELPVEIKPMETTVDENEARRKLRNEFVPPSDFKWPEQLGHMVVMGFDPERAAAQLKKRNGNIDRAVNDLLS